MDHVRKHILNLASTMTIDEVVLRHYMSKDTVMEDIVHSEVCLNRASRSVRAPRLIDETKTLETKRVISIMNNC